MVFEKMWDDRINIFSKELPDLIFFGIDLVFNIFDAVFGSFGAILDEFFDIRYELAYFITHMLLDLNCKIFNDMKHSMNYMNDENDFEEGIYYFFA